MRADTSRCRVGRWNHLWHADAFWQCVGGVESIHRQPWQSMVPRKAERKSGWCFYFHSGATRRKRNNGGHALHPNGAPGIHHRAQWLHSRNGFSGSRDAVRIVIDFRTEQRLANRGGDRGREASGCTRDQGGRSSEGCAVSEWLTFAGRLAAAEKRISGKPTLQAPVVRPVTGTLWSCSMRIQSVLLGIVVSG